MSKDPSKVNIVNQLFTLLYFGILSLAAMIALSGYEEITRNQESIAEAIGSIVFFIFALVLWFGAHFLALIVSIPARIRHQNNKLLFLPFIALVANFIIFPGTFIWDAIQTQSTQNSKAILLLFIPIIIHGTIIINGFKK